MNVPVRPTPSLERRGREREKIQPMDSIIDERWTVWEMERVRDRREIIIEMTHTQENIHYSSVSYRV